MVFSFYVGFILPYNILSCLRTPPALCSHTVHSAINHVLPGGCLLLLSWSIFLLNFYLNFLMFGSHITVQVASAHAAGRVNWLSKGPATVDTSQEAQALAHPPLLPPPKSTRCTPFQSSDMRSCRLLLPADQLAQSHLHIPPLLSSAAQRCEFPISMLNPPPPFPEKANRDRVRILSQGIIPSP